MPAAESLDGARVGEEPCEREESEDGDGPAHTRDMDPHLAPSNQETATHGTLEAMRLRCLALLFALAACGDDGGADGDPIDAFVADAVMVDAAASDASGDAGLPAQRIDIGTGQLDYEPLPEDRSIELVQGAQGGVHIDLALRIWGVAPDDLLLRYEGFVADTDEEVFVPVERLLNADRIVDNGDYLLRAGDRLILDEALLPREELVGREVRVEVTATPPDASPLVGIATVVIVDLE